MIMKRAWLTLLIVMAFASLFIPMSSAQNVSSEVYVTTQDFVSLRSGPGRRFDRLTVVPPATTIRAIGRSVDLRWIQVEYDEETGWIASWLLVWSGDIISLPVDGVGERDPFIRRSLVTGITTRETRLYRRQLSPFDLVGTIPKDIEVEVTGRLGEGDFFWLQINLNGQLYWVGSWDIRLTSGDYDRLTDTSFLYPYGRLATQLSADISGSLQSLVSIEQIWVSLLEGRNASCDSVPAYAVRVAVDNDIAREPAFAPIVTALDSAVIDINAAISKFDDACALPDDEEQITEQDARTALIDLDEARRNLLLAQALVAALGERNPLFDEDTIRLE
jgi:hypothetical protein